MKKIVMLSITIFLVFIGMMYSIYYEKNVCIATVRDSVIEFSGNRYKEVNYEEIGNYKETYKRICKSKDGKYSIYEIEEYPNHEYVVLRSVMNAYVYKKE